MPKIEFPSGPNGGNTMLVKDGGLIEVQTGGTLKVGGLIEVQTGGTLKVGGTEITETTLALTGLTASAAELNKLDGAGAVVASGTQAAHLADLGDAATGAQIATFANAIRDALIAFGIMAAE